MGRSRTRLLTALLAAALSGAIVVPGTVARADVHHGGPSAGDLARSQHQVAEREQSVQAVQAHVTATRARLGTLNTRAEQAVEAYDAARVREQRAAEQVTAARKVVAIADQQVGVARRRLGQFVVAAYMSGGTLTRLKTLALSEGPAALLDKISTLDVLADQRRDAVAAFNGAHAYQQAVAQQAEKALGERRRTAAVADGARKGAQRNVASQQRQLDALRDESAQLVTALEGAKATAARIKDARAQASAAAKAAEQARHVARLRAKADADRHARPTASRHARPTGSRHARPTGDRRARPTADRHAAGSRHQPEQPSQSPSAPAPPQQTSRPSGNSPASGSKANGSSEVGANAGGSNGGVAPGGAAGTISSGGTASAAQQAEAVAWARKQLGEPYVWGAAGPDAFDCSGLTMYVYAKVGVGLDHWTGSQWHAGTHVSRGALRPGDLVFFSSDGTEAGIHHVGIYIGGGQMIEAPHTGANVRIAPAFRSDYIGAVRP